MPVESAADLASFFNPGEFAATVLWSVAGAPAVTVAVLPQTGTVMIEAYDGPPIQSREATLLLAESNLPAEAGQGDAVIKAGKPYQINSIEPDGTGLVLVRLELAGE